jgi:LPS export ABC transporter protein LptC
MTEHSINLTMISTENGAKAYRFQTPLMEGYKLAKDPYMEFREGIDITTYKGEGDTTEIESHLTAQYAIFYEQRKLWEVKGNVVAKNSEGQTLYTQQLFWDQKSKRIYSNVDCKVLMGEDYWFGEGFESDEQMNDWHFRRYRGRMWVDADPNRAEDSTAVDRTISIPTDSRKVNPNTIGGNHNRSHLAPVNTPTERRPNYNSPTPTPSKTRRDEPKREVERQPLKLMEQ